MDHMGVRVNGKFGRTLVAGAIAAVAGTGLICGTAFAHEGHSHGSRHHNHNSDSSDNSDDSHNSDRSHNVRDSHNARDIDDSHEHDGGKGGKGGKNSAKCLVPLGLSAGGLASSGGEVDQCNSNGGNGGEGGAGDVDF